MNALDQAGIALNAISMTDHAWQHEANWLDLNRPATHREVSASLATLVGLSDARHAAHEAWIEIMRKERENVRT